MVSVMSAPENSVPKSSARMVTTGIMALRRTWPVSVARRDSPLALAVRT